MFLWSVATLSCWMLVVVKSHPQINLPSDKVGTKHLLNSLGFPNALRQEVGVRSKRNSDTLITDCIHMSSDEGKYYHKASQLDGAAACGVYLFTEPDKRIELQFNYLDVPCENEGLVAFMDGWELNGSFFPSPEDHPKPANARFSEFCGRKKVKQIFVSSQNVALIMYKMPTLSSSFSFSVRFIKNPTPCNILLQDIESTLTLRNYEKKRNCSITAIFPAAVRVISLSVGVVRAGRRGLELETGTSHKCQKRGLEDYAEIGGSSGLGNSGLMLVDAICGLDSKKGRHEDVIGCGTTTIRLVSSGDFDNSITVAIRQLTEEDISGSMSLTCNP